MSYFAPPPIEADSTTFNFSKALVLMIDGNTASLDVLSQILSGFGFRKFQRCLNLEGVEDVVRTRSLDLILVDPYAFGDRAFDFIRWIRREQLGTNSAVPIMLITGHANMDLISKARAAGADFVVAKPFAPVILLQRILWVAKGEGRGGFMATPASLVSSEGSGIELW